MSHQVMGDDTFLQVFTRGWPVKTVNSTDRCWPPSPEPCIDLYHIQLILKSVEKQCLPGRAKVPVKVYIQPGLLKCAGGWASGCTWDATTVMVTNYYVSWSQTGSRVTHYAAPLAHELKHTWCNTPDWNLQSQSRTGPEGPIHWTEFQP